MATLRERIANLVRMTPGLTDREIADRLLGPVAPQQSVNQVARAMASAGEIHRRPRDDGRIGNFPGDGGVAPRPANGRQSTDAPADSLSEDDVKRKLEAWLEATGWQVTVVWGRGRGLDVEARGGPMRWVIEAKGRGSLNAMRVNYFLAILGELLQRMDDPNAKYSIALPDLPQFRRLWQRLPQLAKRRTCISALFVSDSGRVEEVS